MEISEKEIAKKMAEETGNAPRLSLITARQLKKINNPKLQPYIEG